jgi:hypothetical protein
MLFFVGAIQFHAFNYSFDDKLWCTFLVAFSDEVLNFALDFFAEVCVVGHSDTLEMDIVEGGMRRFIGDLEVIANVKRRP